MKYYTKSIDLSCFCDVQLQVEALVRESKIVEKKTGSVQGCKLEGWN